ncbi:MAG: fused MFS/spermidine synthase, partial [Deltaproteobacteria bacterium]
LLLTGLGSLLARAFRRSSPAAYALLGAFIALWPLLQLVLIRDLREIIFIHGSAPGFYPIFFYILGITSPYCVAVGFILPYALTVLQRQRHVFTSGGLYVTDSIGDIAGGALFSFILVYWMKPFKAIAVTSSLLILSVLLLLAISRKKGLLVLVLFCSVCFYAFSLNSDYERSTLSPQYGDIIRYVESPYGRIVITREGPQHTVWESGVPFYSDAETVHSEEKVHYALSQVDRVGSVLLVSGGLGETILEVAKYNPEFVDYVELDPYLTGLAEELGFVKPVDFLKVINTDGRHYIQGTAKRYDAVVVDLPDPDTFQLNRFYTSEFFSLTKRILNPGGILSFSLEYSPNYLSEIQREKLSTMRNTARVHFQNVLILPGEQAYVLCRDGALTADIPARLRARGIQTSYVEGFYYGNVTSERIEALEKDLEGQGSINTDFEPRIMNIVFQEWFMKHGTSPNLFLVIFLGLTVLYLVLMKKEEYVLFSTGLVTMGAEMLVVFAFQVIYGYIYLKIGAIVTALLLGLLPGALVGRVGRGTRTLDLVSSDLMLLFLLLVFFGWASFFNTSLHPLYFLGYCFVFSFFCGYQFPVAARIIGEERSPAAGCLAADLTGAAVGTLATGTLLIPMWGIRWAVIFLIFIKISSNMCILFAKRKGS